ncbi:MAG: hypothetical protein ACJ8G7_17370 [Rhizobacter sp.]
MAIVAAALALLAGLWAALRSPAPSIAAEPVATAHGSAGNGQPVAAMSAPAGTTAMPTPVSPPTPVSSTSISPPMSVAPSVSPPATAESPATATATATTAPAFQLLGTAVTPEGSLAVLRHPGEAQLMTVRVGDQVDGRVVSAIEPGRIALTAGTPTSRPLFINAETAPSEARLPAAALPAAPRPLPPPTHYTEPEIVVDGH